MGTIPVAFEVITFIVIIAFFIFDLVTMASNPKIPTVHDCVIKISIFVVAALIFGALLWGFAGSTTAIQFYSGWLTEYSLSFDNLFIFVLIMSSFAVPRPIQKYVLGVGITIALILRGIFISVGAVIIQRFTWVFILFGLFLLFTAGKMIFGNKSSDDEHKESALIRFAKHHLHMTNTYQGSLIRVVIDNKKYFTPLLIVFISLGTTDALFALDSIPAIFGLTKNPFVVFTTNVFALLGLEQLYFLLGNMLNKLKYLPIGLSIVLAFIGVKLILEALSSNSLPFINSGRPIPGIVDVPSWVSLLVIVVCIGGAAIASVLSNRKKSGSEVDQKTDKE